MGKHGLTKDEIDTAVRQLTEARIAEELADAQKYLRKKLPRALRRIEKRLRNGGYPLTKVIVPNRFKFCEAGVLSRAVNGLLEEAGASGLCYLGMYYPTSNPYVPIPSGVLSWVEIGPKPANR